VNDLDQPTCIVDMGGSKVSLSVAIVTPKIISCMYMYEGCLLEQLKDEQCFQSNRKNIMFEKDMR